MRAPRHALSSLAGTLAAVFLVGLIIFAAAASLPTPELMDFGSFFASGEAAAAGLDPYGIYPLTFHVVLPGFESWNPNLNPPVALPLFEAFGLLPPHDGFRLWWALSLVLYGACVLLLMRRYPRGLLAGLWALGLAGFWDTLALGQIYIPLVLCAVGAWLLLEDGRPVLGGLLIGIVIAVKPNFLVWPMLLLLSGHVRPVIAAFLTAFALSLVPVLLYGPEVYAQWVALVLNDANRALFLTNASLSGLAQRLGLPLLGTLASLGLLAGLALWAIRKRPEPLLASALGLAGAVLASPIAWVHYTLFLLPVFFAMPASPALVAAGLLLVVPVPAIISLLDAPWWLQVSIGSAYGWAMILCLLGIVSRRHGATKAALRQAQPTEA